MTSFITFALLPPSPFFEAYFRSEPVFPVFGRQIITDDVDHHDKSDNPANADKKVSNRHRSSSPPFTPKGGLVDTNAVKAH